jgi:hypothetical protein
VEVIVPVRIPIPENLLEHPEQCWFPMEGFQVYIFDWDEWTQCLVDSVIFYSMNLEGIKETQE